MDSLDIDWASLMKMSKPKSAPTAGSALKRYTGAAIFARIGLSKAYAGEKLFNKIQTHIQQEMEKDAGKIVCCKWTDLCTNSAVRLESNNNEENLLLIT